ncbi:MAG: NUDIX domain-containing protein [Candidatus Nezhaarchaeales archaeon]
MVSGKEPDDTKVVVSALIPNNGKFLLIKRGENPKRGYYSFPEGHLKRGESPLAGLVRECKEEIGCLVELLSSRVLVLEGPSNAALPDDYLERYWPPLNGRFGFHSYRTADISSVELQKPSGSRKKYIYIPCKLLGSPKETEAALEIVYLSPDKALELKSKGELKLMPTTSLVLALIKLSEFNFRI